MISNKRYRVETKKIKILLLNRNLSVTALARMIGESRAAVSQTINGLRPGRRIRKKIARTLEVPSAEIFPSALQDAA